MSIEELLDTSFLKHSISSSINLSYWCCPAFASVVANKVIDILELLNHPLDLQDQHDWTDCIRNKMIEGYKTDSNSHLILSILVTKKEIKINLFLRFGDISKSYSNWYEDDDRKDIMFGRYPDFKILETVELSAPKTILDLGAGNGRNALGLVRQYQGLAVDVVELTPLFFEKIIEQVEKESLPVRGVCADILDPSLTLENNYYDFIFCSEVVSHFRLDDLFKFFDRCYQWINKPDGILLINIFLADDNYELPDKARQMGEKFCSSCFTQSEMISAIQGKFEIDTIQECLLVEKPHQEYYPPWYRAWASGRNIIPTTYQPPVSLKWVKLFPLKSE